MNYFNIRSQSNQEVRKQGWINNAQLVLGKIPTKNNLVRRSRMNSLNFNNYESNVHQSKLESYENQSNAYANL